MPDNNVEIKEFVNPSNGAVEEEKTSSSKRKVKLTDMTYSALKRGLSKISDRRKAKYAQAYEEVVSKSEKEADTNEFDDLYRKLERIGVRLKRVDFGMHRIACMHEAKPANVGARFIDKIRAKYIAFVNAGSFVEVKQDMKNAYSISKDKITGSDAEERKLGLEQVRNYDKLYESFLNPEYPMPEQRVVSPIEAPVVDLPKKEEEPQVIEQKPAAPAEVEKVTPENVAELIGRGFPGRTVEPVPEATPVEEKPASAAPAEVEKVTPENVAELIGRGFPGRTAEPAPEATPVEEKPAPKSYVDAMEESLKEVKAPNPPVFTQQKMAPVFEEKQDDSHGFVFPFSFTPEVSEIKATPVVEETEHTVEEPVRKEPIKREVFSPPETPFVTPAMKADEEITKCNTLISELKQKIDEMNKEIAEAEARKADAVTKKTKIDSEEREKAKEQAIRLRIENLLDNNVPHEQIIDSFSPQNPEERIQLWRTLGQIEGERAYNSQPKSR